MLIDAKERPDQPAAPPPMAIFTRRRIVRVTVDGKAAAMQAFGDSMTGVPATTDMQFRNGAVAFVAS